MNTKVTAKNVIDIAKAWLSFSESNGKFLEILNVYNSHKPLARGYAIKPSDEWCDTFVSAVAIKAGAVDLIGTEVGCPKHLEIFKQKGIWIEDGTITPQVGDIVLFNWDDTVQPNDGQPDHIGYVEQVLTNTFITIEGNKNSKVDRRKLKIGDKYIRGFARPKYAVQEVPSVNKMIAIVAKEVIDGKWGVGDERKMKLIKAGYDYKVIQAKVNELLKG